MPPSTSPLSRDRLNLSLLTLKRAGRPGDDSEGPRPTMCPTGCAQLPESMAFESIALSLVSLSSSTCGLAQLPVLCHGQPSGRMQRCALTRWSAGASDRWHVLSNLCLGACKSRGTYESARCLAMHWPRCLLCLLCLLLQHPPAAVQGTRRRRPSPLRCCAAALPA
jgi:hypothetical protein